MLMELNFFRFFIRMSVMSSLVFDQIEITRSYRSSSVIRPRRYWLVTVRTFSSESLKSSCFSCGTSTSDTAMVMPARVE
ncbi:hypothetical protein D3C75_957310 [compost metagenome]